MNLKESIKQFLPKYLSETEQKKLLAEIKAFPQNLDTRFYTDYLREELVVFQGDGVSGLKISNLPSEKFIDAKCIVTSNTCDTNLDNQRLFRSRLTYCPLIDFEKYIDSLFHYGIDKTKIANHSKAIKKQEVTQILYLPANSKSRECIVFLDRVNNCELNAISTKNIKERRLFTLSNYGFYMFLLKMSISFTRIGEGVDRKIPNE